MVTTKRKILKTASQLFSEFGFSAVSMQKIAQKLRITKPALYHHFKNKKEIYFEVLNNSVERLKKEIEKRISQVKSKEEILSKIIEGYLEFCLRERNLISLFHLTPPKNEAKMRIHLQKIKKEINCFFEKKLRKISKNPELIHYLLGALEGIAMKVKGLPRKKWDIKKIATKITKAYFIINTK